MVFLYKDINKNVPKFIKGLRHLRVKKKFCNIEEIMD